MASIGCCMFTNSSMKHVNHPPSSSLLYGKLNDDISVAQVWKFSVGHNSIFPFFCWQMHRTLDWLIADFYTPQVNETNGKQFQPSYKNSYIVNTENEKARLIKGLWGRI